MRGHVDAESLALCAEGQLSRRQSERIRAHVATCPECAAAQARLSEVPALLAQVPPPALPPGIAARLDAALSAETGRRAAQAPGRAPTGRRTTRRTRRRPPVPGGRPWPAGAPAARAAAPGGRPGAGRGRCAGRGGRGRLRGGPVLPAHLDLVRGIDAAAAPAVSAHSGPAIRGPSSGNVPALGGTTFTVTHSGTSYHPHTFAAQAARVLAHLLHRPDPPRKPARPVPALRPGADRVRDHGGGRGTRQ